MTANDYQKAFMELRAFNIERMGKSEWLHWFIASHIEMGCDHIRIPADTYPLNRPMDITGLRGLLDGGTSKFIAVSSIRSANKHQLQLP